MLRACNSAPTCQALQLLHEVRQLLLLLGALQAQLQRRQLAQRFQQAAGVHMVDLRGMPLVQQLQLPPALAALDGPRELPVLRRGRRCALPAATAVARR